uniref:Uncharacterized protein n=1 Tax=Arundo donax TaxID=35708 RepID=A0A0A9E6H5_ARUDO
MSPAALPAPPPPTQTQPAEKAPKPNLERLRNRRVGGGIWGGREGRVARTEERR